MSLYNQLLGVNPIAPNLLAELELDYHEIERFRDCYIDDDHNIVVFTRTGGDNRYTHSYSNNRLKDNRYYLKDEDDEFDCTYAHFTFKCPEDLKDKIKEIKLQFPRNSRKDFKKLLDKMKDPNQQNHPDVKHAMEVGKNLMGPILKDMMK